MSKHTPGPWIVANGGRMVATAAEGANGWELFDVRDDVYGYQHNARLISAAPDLLEALDALANSAPDACCVDFHHGKKDLHGPDDKCPPLERWHSACLSARAAIAKAKGETK